MAERYLQPQASNFSVLNTSDSQVLGTADTLSIPSEPPDIRNWFSSYAYESPKLYAADDFEGCTFRGSDCAEEGFDGEERSKEKKENLEEFRKIRKKDELVLGEVASNGFVKSNNTAEDRNHKNNNASQVLDHSDSLLLSSEPPDITRWFSSYVYESPALDTSNDYKGSVFTESEYERMGCNAENCSKEKDENLKDFRGTNKRHVLAADEKISASGLVKRYSSVMDKKYDHQYNTKDIHSVAGNNVSSVLNSLPVNIISGEALKGKPIENLDIGSTQNVEKLSVDGECLIVKKAGNREADITLNANGCSGRNRKSLKKLTHSRDLAEESLAQKEKHGLLARASNLGIIRKPACGSTDKENDGKIFAENGFISTRNNGSARTDTVKRSVEVQSRNRMTVPSVVDREAILRRKPLSETTNFQCTYASEVTGKWQCPQKSKPNLGPPLKQLRLEGWVRRV